MVNWESPKVQKTDTFEIFTYSICILSSVQKLVNSLLVHVNMNICFCFYFNIARDVVMGLLISVIIHHFKYTFSHAHKEI